MSVLSIDLGTSNTVAALAAHGQSPRVVEVEGSAAMSSAVFAAEDGDLVVGKEAERRARLDPARFEPNPKRRVDEGSLLLGDRVVPVVEAFAAVLRKVGEEAARQLGGAQPDEVRLTHPAQWGLVRRNVLLAAARQAGLGPILILVPEPVAAAAHFASFADWALSAGQVLAVYDFGAGTVDVAVVSELVVLAESGLADLGGLDVDQALLAYVGMQVSTRDPSGWQRLMRPQSTLDRRSQRALQEDVRAAKEALSTHPQTEMPLPVPFGDVLVTRTELEGLIRSNLLRGVELLDTTIRSAGLTRERLAGVYLVGGSSRIPLVATLIAEQVGIVPANLDQPETAVALGAHHVSPEGTSLRTEGFADALPAVAGSDERTISITPPPRPPATVVSSSRPVTTPLIPAVHMGQSGLVMPVPPPSPQPTRLMSTASGIQGLPWYIAAGILAVGALVVMIVVLPSRGGDASGAEPTITETRTSGNSSTATTHTSPSPTTTGATDVIVGHPKVVTDETDCASLLTVADVSKALTASAIPSATGDPCYFSVHFPGATDGSQLAVRVSTAQPLYGEKSDFGGNTAYEDGKDVTVIDSEQGAINAAHCEVSVALGSEDSRQDRSDYWLTVELTVDTAAQPVADLCDAMWTLAQIAFDNLPDA